MVVIVTAVSPGFDSVAVNVTVASSSVTPLATARDTVVVSTVSTTDTVPVLEVSNPLNPPPSALTIPNEKFSGST